MSATYESAVSENGLPYIAKVFVASSGEKFYVKTYLSEADRGIEFVPLAVINTYLTAAESYLRDLGSNISCLAVNEGDPAARYPGFPELEKFIDVAEEASGWWNWAERNYYDLIEEEEEEEEDEEQEASEDNV